VQLEFRLPVGDFPPVNKFRETVREGVRLLEGWHLLLRFVVGFFVVVISSWESLM
jgi:hypothetical protein